MKIDSVSARSISDTRGRATIETTLSAGAFTAVASVPSGKSTGIHEALELRDADGSVASAIANVNGEIANALIGRDFVTADELDTVLIELDGTPNKSRLGANALLSVSIATARLFAQEEGVPLWKSISKRAGTTPSAPRLYINMMNGGTHVHPSVALPRPSVAFGEGGAKGDRFPLPFQEYLLVVEGKTSDALPIAREAFAKLGKWLGAGVPMGDEGGYAPSFDTLEKPFELLAELVQEFPHTSIAVDAAASELFKNDHYELLGKSYSAPELTTIYGSIVAQFPIHSIEDPFDEESADDFTRLTALLSEKVLIIGDDLTVTNPVRIKEAAERKEINAVLIKPNQIGTVREAIQAVQATYAEGFAAVASHRSGETDDTFIADFAYGIGAHGIKAGGLAQSERLAKYERLLAIESEIETL